MKILFGKKYYGKYIEEVPSGFLVWIIEDYDGADWSLIQSAKQELSARLKLDWSPKTDTQRDLDTATKQLEALRAELDLLRDLLAMATLCGANRVVIDGYRSNPAYLYSNLKLIKDANA